MDLEYGALEGNFDVDEARVFVREADWVKQDVGGAMGADIGHNAVLGDRVAKNPAWHL